MTSLDQLPVHLTGQRAVLAGMADEYLGHRASPANAPQGAQTLPSCLMNPVSSTTHPPSDPPRCSKAYPPAHRPLRPLRSLTHSTFSSSWRIAASASDDDQSWDHVETVHLG